MAFRFSTFCSCSSANFSFVSLSWPSRIFFSCWKKTLRPLWVDWEPWDLLSSPFLPVILEYLLPEVRNIPGPFYILDILCLLPSYAVAGLLYYTLTCLTYLYCLSSSEMLVMSSCHLFRRGTAGGRNLVFMQAPRPEEWEMVWVASRRE